MTIFAGIVFGVLALLFAAATGARNERSDTEAVNIGLVLTLALFAASIAMLTIGRLM